MAPSNKRSRGYVAKKDKKPRRRGANADDIYKHIGNLCGEVCDQPIMDAMDVMSEYSDDDYEVRAPPVVKTGRVAKPKPKKAPTLQQLPMKVGVQKAQRYICEALDFGLNAGYLTTKDAKGKVLVLSSDLLQMSDAIRDNNKRPAAKEPAAAEARRSVQQQQQQRRRRSPGSQPEVRDDEDVGEKHASRRRRSHSRSKRRHGRRRSARSRSKRRSKRRAGGRSRSINPEGEPRAKQTSAEEAQQDALEEAGRDKEGSGAEDDKDTRSVKSSKSSKPAQRSAEPQGGSDEKSLPEPDAEGSSDDEDDKK